MVDDDIKNALKLMGCAKHVVDGGLEYLMQAWRSLVSKLAAKYTKGIDEFRNSLDGRSILAEVLERVPAGKQAQIIAELNFLDEEFRRRTLPSETAVNSWRTDYWWNYRYPEGMYVPGQERDCADESNGGG